MSCGVGCRCGSDPMSLWLWRRPVATAPIQPLAWEPPYAAGAAQEIATTTATTTTTTKKDKRQKKIFSHLIHRRLWGNVLIWWPSSEESVPWPHRAGKQESANKALAKDVISQIMLKITSHSTSLNFKNTCTFTYKPISLSYINNKFRFVSSC